ncbi:MAG: addiction module protein [Burkholderiales bacterium]|nr:addiction module protein [Burkholderiales bacterium]
MAAIDTSALKQLPIPDRLSVIEDIWDSIDHDSADLQVPQWHREVLRKRLAAFRANPVEGKPWPEVRRRIERGQESEE